MTTSNKLPSAAEVLKRLAAVIGVRSDIELAKRLKVATQTVATWKKRNKIPYEKIVEMAAKEGFCIDDLLFENRSKLATLTRGNRKSQEDSDSAELMHFIFNYMNEQLPLKEQIPEQEPFYFICRVFNEVLRQRNGNWQENLEEAFSVAKTIADEDIRFYQETMEFARKNLIEKNIREN